MGIEVLLPDGSGGHTTALGGHEVLVWGRPGEGSLGLIRPVLIGCPLTHLLDAVIAQPKGKDRVEQV